MKGQAVIHSESPLIDLGEGVTRRILAYNEQIMAVEVAFRQGARGAVHTHPHTQMSYVLSGRFSYSIEGEETLLGPGDSIVVPSGLPHGTLCLEEGILLDVFTPMREDFLPAK